MLPINNPIRTTTVAITNTTVATLLNGSGNATLPKAQYAT